MKNPVIKRQQIITLSQILLIMMVILGAVRATGGSAQEQGFPRDTALIAHALGQAKGFKETNAVEGLTEGYENGLRVFEVDLIFTSDRQLVARHDWTEYLAVTQKQPLDWLPKERRDMPLSLKEFKSLSIYETLTPASLYDVLAFMYNHPDVYLVTDTKETEPNAVREQFSYLISAARKIDESLLERIVPQFYNEEMFYIIRELYDFNDYIFTLYQTTAPYDHIVSFVKKNNISIVTMPPERINADFIKKLKKLKVLIYTHTINDREEFNKYINQGLNGVYTDFLTPDK